MTVPYACTITPDELIEALGMVFLFGFAAGAGLCAMIKDWRR